MKNQVHGLATLYVLKNTDLTEEEFLVKFHQESIVNAKLTVTLATGETVEVPAFLEQLDWTEYIKEEATEQKPSDSLNE